MKYFGINSLEKLITLIKSSLNKKSELIKLLTVSDTAPSTCLSGDMYYNTQTNLIYTAIANNAWGEAGTNPKNKNLYIDLEHTNIYYYDGVFFKSYSGISGSGNSEPLSTSKIYFGTTEPEGYLFANGQAISRTEYAELFSIIGTAYGAGDGSTTFNLPNMSGRVPVGLHVNKEWFNQLGKTGGSEEVTLTIEQMPIHTHIQESHSHNIGRDNDVYGGSDGDFGSIHGAGVNGAEVIVPTSSTTAINKNAGGGKPHTNLQPYITVNYIIKVKNIASENVIVPDYIPIGTELDYEGTEVPEGYEEVYETPDIKVIWSNPKPTDNFPETVCELTESIYNYGAYSVLYKQGAGNTTHVSNTMVPLGNSRAVTAISGLLTWRDSAIVDATHVRIGVANQPGSVTDQSLMIPVYIIGYRTNVFQIG